MSISLTIDFEISFLYVDSLPSNLISFIPKSTAKSCNSHSPDFWHTRQSLGWSDNINSKTVFLAFNAFIVFVLTTIPSVTGVAHEGAKFLLPSTSTTHTLHDADLFTQPKSAKFK